ncbi:hypothetical protein ES702_00477 [subsurface metagenome]
MKFRFSKDFIVDSSVEPYCREGLRITMLGGPGSGKSWNNSLIAEQFLKQAGTVIIFQPRDEYFTLKEKFDVVCVGGVHAKDVDFVLMKPKMYARAVVEDGISMIFYTAGKDEEKLVDWVTRFIEQVLTFQETHHRPLLIILEEAQEYVPKSAAGHTAPPWVFNRMIRTFKKCFTEGRKLNVIAIASSQRPQEINFTVRQLANVKFFGLFSEQDIKYVDKECLAILRTKLGLDIQGDKLLDLKEGEWLVVAGKRSQYIHVTHPRLTKHGAKTPKLEYIAPRTSKTKKTVSDLAAAIKEALEKQEAEVSELQKLKRKNRDLEKKLAIAEEKAKIKLAVKEMLKGDGNAEELAEKLAKTDEELRSVTEAYEEMTPKFVVLEERLTQFKREHEIVENLRKLFVIEPTSLGSQTILQSTKIIVDVPPVMKSVTINDVSVQGKILTVARKGLLAKWRKLGEIVKAVIEEGWTVSPQQVNNGLTDLVKRQLIAKKHTDRNYFKLAKNVIFQKEHS